MEQSIFKRLWIRFQRFIQPFYVSMNFKTLHGPSSMKTSKSEFTVICMVKDGEYFVDDFINYYTKLGALHIVFVDNGSTDSTLSKAKKYKNTSILQCTLAAKHYENYMRRHAAYKFCRGGWCLFADMDEFIDYPGSESVGMKVILNYLNTNRYTAVVGQMVDMYPLTKISDNDGSTNTDNFLELHKYYETDNISFVGYHDLNNPNEYFNRANTIPSENIKYAYGGVRQRIFGSNNLLTKHPLVKIVSGVTPSIHPSCSTGVNCADFEIILKHYKFAGDFAARVSKEVKSRTWDHGETESYLQKLEKESPIMYSPGLSKIYINAMSLIDGEFIYASDRFLKTVDTI